jgi:hypothetical protein
VEGRGTLALFRHLFGYENSQKAQALKWISVYKRMWSFSKRKNDVLTTVLSFHDRQTLAQRMVDSIQDREKPLDKEYPLLTLLPEKIAEIKFLAAKEKAPLRRIEEQTLKPKPGLRKARAQSECFEPYQTPSPTMRQ